MSTPITSDDSQYIISLLHQILQKHDHLDQKMDGIEERMDGLEDRMNSFEERMDGLEIQAELRHHDLLDILNDGMSLLKDKHTDHDYRIRRLEQKVGLAV